MLRLLYNTKHLNLNMSTSKSNRQIELMSKARSAASFKPRNLTCIIYDGEHAVNARETILSRLEIKLDESNSETLPRLHGGLDRASQYHNGLRFGKALLEDEVNHHHRLFNRATHNNKLINASPFGLHSGMFIPTLKLQGSPEQQAYWLPLAESGKIIGTYCQTELGHGTFVRGLETTATFDHLTDEFILHSPTLTSTQYWPGGLGYSSSHAVVMAHLIIHGTDHGVHPFITQLRSLDDFQPMPGIELGDIGLKMGLNSTDNGYAIFNHIRIPRMHLLMGNAQVLRDGTYLKAQSNEKHLYSTMIYTRNLIIHTVAFQLAQAATIAIRYSVVREQGNLSFDPNNADEFTIMAYRSQQHRLFTIMARAFAILFASKTCEAMYQDLVFRQTRDDNSTLAHCHITTAALKAYASQNAADGAEDARKCCGGHGYSSLSGLPDLVADITPIATLEGENYVMYQQAARYLVKTARAIRQSQVVDPSMSYLIQGYHEQIMPVADRRCTGQGGDFLDQAVQTSIFCHRAVRMIFECQSSIDEACSRGCPADVAWNDHIMVLISAARAHIEYFVLESFINGVSRVQDTAVRNVLKRLVDLFALSSIESPLSVGSLGFFEDGYISTAQLREIRAHVNNILSSLVPEAVGLTDSWNFSDSSLQSALGRKDGNVYETLLSWTRQTPLNVASRKTGGVDRVGFDAYIRPMLQGRAKL